MSPSPRAVSATGTVLPSSHSWTYLETCVELAA